MKNLLCAAFACGCLAIPVFAADDTYALKWAPKEGQTFTYANEGSLDLNGGAASMKTQTQEKILKVDADGNYTVQSTTLPGGSVTYLGQQMQVPMSQTVIIYRPDGELVSIEGKNVGPESYRGNNLMLLRRPDNPMKLGDKWPVEVKADSKTGAVAMKGTFTLEGEEKVGDFSTLKISAHNAEAEGSQSGTVDATFWVDKTDGSMVKCAAKWTNVAFPGSPAPVSGTMTVTRVP